eukprot:5967714-Amphidinium_carterae.1
MQNARRPNQPRPPARAGIRRGTRARNGTPKPADPAELGVPAEPRGPTSAVAKDAKEQHSS